MFTLMKSKKRLIVYSSSSAAASAAAAFFCLYRSRRKELIISLRWLYRNLALAACAANLSSSVAYFRGLPRGLITSSTFVSFIYYYGHLVRESQVTSFLVSLDVNSLMADTSIVTSCLVRLDITSSRHKKTAVEWSMNSRRYTIS